MSDIYGYSFGAMATEFNTYIVGFENELEEEDVAHAAVFESYEGKRTYWSVEFRAASVAYAHSVKLFFLIGLNGNVEVTSSTEAWDENVDSSENGPSSVRAINGACVIGEHIYVAGMRRQVYRRSLGARIWSRFDAGCFIDPATIEIRGFSAIHGLNESEIYAVGLRGEIWCCINGKWYQIDSPTNISLYTVRVLASGDVLIGGGLGSLLRGDSKKFTPIEHQETTSSITGIAEFLGRIFIADEGGALFELIGDVLVLVPDLPKIENGGGGQLDVNDVAMIYTRADSVLLFDGHTWRDCTPPDEA